MDNALQYVILVYRTNVSKLQLKTNKCIDLLYIGSAASRSDKILFEKMYVIPLSRLNSKINEVRKHENSVLGITTLATNKE